MDAAERARFRGSIILDRQIETDAERARQILEGSLIAARLQATKKPERLVRLHVGGVNPEIGISTGKNCLAHETYRKLWDLAEGRGFRPSLSWISKMEEGHATEELWMFVAL